MLALGFIYLAGGTIRKFVRSAHNHAHTVPLTMTGALALTQLTGRTLNIYSEIGLVALIGLISKHGIPDRRFA